MIITHCREEKLSTSEIIIKEYDESNIDAWDDFVLRKSVNGTFLQTRNFLNYHPYGRFRDASLVAYMGSEMVAVCPGHMISGDDGEEFYSHKGSTYGGIIISRKQYNLERVLQIVKTFDLYFEARYKKVLLKITPGIFSLEKPDLLEYLLTYLGYKNYVELNLVLDLKNLENSVIDSFDRNKRRNIFKCEEHNLVFRELASDDEVGGFHDLLSINLSKYNLKPIHTKEELIDFRNKRLVNNTEFYGVFEQDKMMAAGMMFKFEQTNVIHAQNLSADFRFNDYSPITYLYYKVIEKAKKDGYSYLSWGISTEDCGKVINHGLVRNKESYGSKYELNKTFYKEYK